MVCPGLHEELTWIKHHRNSAADNEYGAAMQLMLMQDSDRRRNGFGYIHFGLNLLSLLIPCWKERR